MINATCTTFWCGTESNRGESEFWKVLFPHTRRFDESCKRESAEEREWQRGKGIPWLELRFHVDITQIRRDNITEHAIGHELGRRLLARVSAAFERGGGRWAAREDAFKKRDETEPHSSTFALRERGGGDAAEMEPNAKLSEKL